MSRVASFWRRSGRLSRRKVANLLESALEQGELELHYQPQYVLATRASSGLEVFLRWRSPVLGLLPAKEFVGIAVASGQMVGIGRWVIRSAAAQLSAWRAEGVPVRRLALNVSPAQLVHSDFLRCISETVYDYGLEPGDLELEVAEPARLRDADEVREKLTELHHLGIRLALDGFGAARSSLGFLVRAPFRSIKISGELVRSIDSSDASRQDIAMLNLSCGLGRRMKMPVAAGGVETERQRRALVQMGCTLAQGRLFASPQPAEEIAKVLRRDHEHSPPLKQTLSEGTMLIGH